MHNTHSLRILSYIDRFAAQKMRGQCCINGDNCCAHRSSSVLESKAASDLANGNMERKMGPKKSAHDGNVILKRNCSSLEGACALCVASGNH